mgnify:CR=1 FL=1
MACPGAVPSPGHGAGAVGCEFADVFSAFGAEVHLIEVLPTLLPLEDADCSADLARAFKKRKINLHTGAKISGVKVGKDGVKLSVEVASEKVGDKQYRIVIDDPVGLHGAFMAGVVERVLRQKSPTVEVAHEAVTRTRYHLDVRW